MKNILIVPSNRPQSIKNFLNAWSSYKFDDIIVIEDNKEKSFDINIKHHYSWKEIDEELGEKSFIFSRQDSQIRSFGFYKAFKLCPDNNVFYTLDDDCLPSDDRFIEQHINNLYHTSKWSNVLPGINTRGIPYYNIGILDNVNLSIGGHNGIPDLDAIHSLSSPITNFTAPNHKFILANDQYYPLPGMNVAFKSQITPLMYFPIMNEGKRYDDIWAFLLAKKIFDHLGWHISYGMPRIMHEKASNPFVNLRKESIFLERNETFWEIIDNINLKSNLPSECMLEIADCLQKTMDDYYSLLGRSIKVWISLF